MTGSGPESRQPAAAGCDGRVTAESLRVVEDLESGRELRQNSPRPSKRGTRGEFCPVAFRPTGSMLTRTGPTSSRSCLICIDTSSHSSAAPIPSSLRFHLLLAVTEGTGRPCWACSGQESQSLGPAPELGVMACLLHCIVEALGIVFAPSSGPLAALFDALQGLCSLSCLFPHRGSFLHIEISPLLTRS